MSNSKAPAPETSGIELLTEVDRLLFRRETFPTLRKFNRGSSGRAGVDRLNTIKVEQLTGWLGSIATALDRLECGVPPAPYLAQGLPKWRDRPCRTWTAALLMGAREMIIALQSAVDEFAIAAGVKPVLLGGDPAEGSYATKTLRDNPDQPAVWSSTSGPSCFQAIDQDLLHVLLCAQEEWRTITPARHEKPAAHLTPAPSAEPVSDQQDTPRKMPTDEAKLSGALDGKSVKAMTWQDAMKFAENHCARNPFPGVNALAKIARQETGKTCSTSTMSRAVKESAVLRERKAQGTRRSASVSAAPMTDRISATASRTDSQDPVHALAEAELREKQAKIADDPLLRRLMQDATPAQRQQYIEDMSLDRLRELAVTAYSDRASGTRKQGRSR